MAEPFYQAMKELPTPAAVRRILSKSPKARLDDPSLSPAGVMVLLYPKDGEYCILLNKRSQHVEKHKGEISFPGGHRDERDLTLLDTALRETHEEMGIRPQDVEVLGELDDVATTSNYVIRPFVGTIPSPYRFKPSDREVAEVLEAPLALLCDAGRMRDDVRLVGGRLVGSPAYAYRGHLIFGATARILRRLIELLESAPDEEAPWKKRRH